MICVDPLMKREKIGRMWSQSCHLFDDIGDKEALHNFAKKMGCKRSWFQDRHNYPHYDLTLRMRAIAVEHGAKEVDRRYFVEIYKAHVRQHSIQL